MHPIVFLISVLIGFAVAWFVAGGPALRRLQPSVARCDRGGYRGEAE